MVGRFSVVKPYFRRISPAGKTSKRGLSSIQVFTSRLMESATRPTYSRREAAFLQSPTYNFHMTTPAAEFGGEELFAATPERVFAVLADLDALAASIPDLVSADRPDANTLRCVVKPGFSFLRGTLKLAITMTDIAPPRSAAMTVAAQGIGVSMQVRSSIEIEPAGAGSRLVWSATLERMTGLLGSVSPGLVKAAADQTIRHAWRQVRQRLGE